MASARSIIDKLIGMGIIASEYREAATQELHTELSRRSRRTAATLARLVSRNQLAVNYARLCTS